MRKRCSVCPACRMGGICCHRLPCMAAASLTRCLSVHTFEPSPLLRRYEGKFETSLLRTWASAKSLPLVIKFG